MSLEKISDNMINKSIESCLKWNKIIRPNAIETGFLDLDYVLGGLKRGETYLLEGGDNFDITLFALNLVINMTMKREFSEGSTVAYFSQFYTEESILEKLLKILTGVNSEGFDCLLKKGQFKQLEEAKGKLKEANLYLDHERLQEISEIIIRSSAIESNLDVVIIDSLESIFTKDMDQFRRNLNYISDFAKKRNCVVIYLAHYSEASKESNVSGNVFVNFGAPIEKDIFENRISISLEKDEDFHSDTVVQVFIDKSKNSSNATVRIGYLPEYMKFYTLGLKPENKENKYNVVENNVANTETDVLGS